MKTKKMKLADITLAGYNPRVTLKPGDYQYEALKNSIERFGLVEPLIVNKRTGTLVGGHQRLNALLAMGETEAEVVEIDADESREKLLNVALNKIDGGWDFDKLDDLFESIAKEDIRFTGFTEEEVEGAFLEDFYEEPPEGSGEPKEPAEPKQDTGFTVYLSFPEKKAAEEWLQAEGIDKGFGTGRNITVKMKGTLYG